MKKILALLLCVCFCFSLAACLEDDPKKEGPAATQSQSQEATGQELVFGLKETAVFQNLKFTADQLQVSTGGTMFQAGEGKEFVGIQFTVENISQEEQTVSSIMLFEAYVDDVKASLSLGAVMAFEGQSLDGSVAPGKKLVGWYGLEVDENWQEIELNVQADWLAQSQARFVFSAPQA